MWHSCKQRAFALFGFQKFSSQRAPFGRPRKDQAKPQNDGDVHFLACCPVYGQGTQQNKRKTCDGKTKNNFQHLHYCPLLETLSWVGTAFAVGLNYKLCWKTRNSTEKNELEKLSCFCKATNLLLRLALSMPKALPRTTTNILPLSAETSLISLATVSNGTDAEIFSPPNKPAGVRISEVEASCQALEDVMSDYFAELENMAGLELLTVNKTKAFNHFLLASDLGSVKGHFNVGVCYETGQGTAVDLQKAAHYYTKASDAGHSFASYNLGLYYMEGRDDIVQQPEEGLKYMRKASDLGMSEADYYLGVCYQAGWRVEENIQTAKEYFAKASSLGHEAATDALSDMNTEENESAEIKQQIHFSISPIDHERDIDVEKEVNQYFQKDYITTFHLSASSPDLKSSQDHFGKQAIKSYELAISRYLDVILPYRWIPDVPEDTEPKNVELIPNVAVPRSSVMKVCLGM